MNLRKYQLKISLFISFLIFFIFSLMGIFFVLYNNWKNEATNLKKLNYTEKHLKTINQENFQKIINNLNEISIINIISSALSSQTQNNNKVEEIIGAPFVNISQNNFPIFNNFNPKKCGASYLCKTFKYKDYKITIAFKKKAFSYYLILQILLISFISSIIIFPFILLIIKAITQPIKENLDFMENFINNAGHEIKTPLANINLAAQILLTQGFNKKLITDIEKESKHLGKIIDSLLELTSIIKYKQKTNINLINIAEKILKKYPKEKFIKEFENTIKKINPTQFEILFENLIKNAIKYKSESPIIIKLNSNYLEIKNKTTNLPNFNKIFELFYKANSGSEGYGIGLSIVKKICEVNNWKIKNTSDKNWFGIRIDF